MKRTSAEANDNNRYTEGNPAQGIPATVVGAEEMNNLQEELANIVEAAGITLNGSIETQALQAIRLLIQRGGEQVADFTIADAQSSQDVTGLSFDGTDFSAFRVLYSLNRRNDSQSADQVGEMFGVYRPESNDWLLETSWKGEDAGVIFSITAAGQVQYTSDTYGGTGYAATLKATAITTVAQ